MPSRPTGVSDTAPGTGIVEVDVVERSSPDLITTTTADPGAAGTTLAVSSAAKFPSTNNFKINVEAERMLVTAGAGTTSWTVTRGIDNTTAVAHTSGVVVAYVVGVQRVEPVSASRQSSFFGRVSTFRTPGRAGTTGQNIFAIHNATASPVFVNVKKISVDLAMTVVKAITVLPPTVRLWRFTAVPTLGTAGTKVAEDTNLTSKAAVTVWQDASAEGTSSASALAVTRPANNQILGEFAPRWITGAGYEPFDRTVFFESEDEIFTLRPLEGLCVFLDYTLATQNPVTDMWVVNCQWEEFTAA